MRTTCQPEGGAGAGAPGPEGSSCGWQQAQPGLQRSERGPLLPGEPEVLPPPTLPASAPEVGRGALCMVAGKSLSKQHFTEREPLFYVSSEIDI